MVHCIGGTHKECRGAAHCPLAKSKEQFHFNLHLCCRIVLSLLHLKSPLKICIRTERLLYCLYVCLIYILPHVVKIAFTKRALQRQMRKVTAVEVIERRFHSKPVGFLLDFQEPKINSRFLLLYECSSSLLLFFVELVYLWQVRKIPI